MSQQAPRPRDGLLAAAWQPAGLLYMACLMAGLAVGLWAPSIFPSNSAIQAAPLPTLQTICAAQVAYLFLVHPLVAMRRMIADPPRPYWRESAIQAGTMLALSAPFYVIGAHLADASATDALRAAILVAAMLPAAWSLGALTNTPRLRAAALIVAWSAVLAAPAAYYVVQEFLPVWQGYWIWDIGPATLMWNTAASRQDTLWPYPVWAMLFWPLLGLSAVMVRGVAWSRRLRPR